MPITATPVIGLQVVFGDKMFKIFEGDIVTDLAYQEGVVQKKVSGTVRVMNVNTRSYSAGPDECPPESFIHEITAVTELIIDTSGQYDADLVHVETKNIISIGKVNDQDPVDAVIDPSMKILYVYDQATWDAAQAAGVPVDWMPVYNPEVETHPWMVIIFNRGSMTPAVLSSLVITGQGGTIPHVINSSDMFADGSYTMENDQAMIGFEMIVPDVTDGKDYLSQHKVTKNATFTAYAVMNDNTTMTAQERYLGPAI